MYSVCKKCGKRFTRKAGSVAKYCSPACRAISTNINAHYKSGIYLSKSGRREVYQSALEERHMMLLDAKGVKWCRANHIAIPYYNSRLKRQAVYYPDFIVWTREGCFLQELKPLSKTMDITVQEKANAARRWAREHGYEYIIVTEAGVLH